MKRFICACLLFSLFFTVAFADDVPTLRILGAYYDESIQLYASAGHSVDFRYGSFVDIATALASKIQTLMFSSLKLTLVLIK